MSKRVKLAVAAMAILAAALLGFFIWRGRTGGVAEVYPVSNLNFFGDSYATMSGTIEAGKRAQQVLNLKIVKTEWNRDNMKVMVIASRKGDNNKMDVVNVVVCDINDTVSYNYNK
jgi:hypothetical protein